MTGARFFQWLQGADFYRELHRAAVEAVPGAGRRWLDVGSGAGVVALLAAERGHLVTGADRSPAMVARARSLAAAGASGARFEVASLEALVTSGRQAEVVSAASLLSPVPARARALEALWGLVAPGGTLLVVETTPAMRPSRAWPRVRGRRGLGLLLWGLARRGRSAAPLLEAFRPPGLARAVRQDLEGGLVAAWHFLKQSPQSPRRTPTGAPT